MWNRHIISINGIGIILTTIIITNLRIFRWWWFGTKSEVKKPFYTKKEEDISNPR